MKYCFKAALLLVLIAVSEHSYSQQLNGNWYGLGNVLTNGESSSYMAELKLKQKGKLVTGTFSYYFRDSLFTTKLTGSYDAQARKLQIDPLPVIYYRSTSTLLGVDCYMTGSFTLLSSRTETSLNGRFTSDAAHRYTVPDLLFRFRFSVDTAAIAVETGLEPVDSTSLARKDNTDSVKTSDTAVLTREDFLARPKTYAKDLEISAPFVRIELYDNGTVDNDMISLFVNNKEVLHKASLTHKAIKLTVPLDPRLPYTELSMYAENLGTIPPNTAAMIIYDGNTRHELILTSDLDKSATIRLKRKEQ